MVTNISKLDPHDHTYLDAQWDWEIANTNNNNEPSIEGGWVVLDIAITAAMAHRRVLDVKHVDSIDEGISGL